MLGLTLILAMSCPAWAGKCKVDWTRGEAEGRSVFDHQGRPLRVGAATADGRAQVSVEWVEAGPASLRAPGRRATARWEGGHPVLLSSEAGETRTEDRWTWAGGVVGSWSRCSWEGGEAQPCTENSYAYDPQGRLVRIADPQGSHLLRWEGENLVEHTWPQSGTVHRLTWDAIGRLASAAEEAGGVAVVESYTRDEWGRVVRREVRAGEVLLEAEVAEYEGARLVRVGRIEGDETAWVRVLSWDARGHPTSMEVEGATTTWAWRGDCEATIASTVHHLGLAVARPLPVYLAPWLSEDLDLGLPWVPGDLP